nr:translation initiation factor 2 subunit beta [Paratrimastix eleionoma]
MSEVSKPEEVPTSTGKEELPPSTTPPPTSSPAPAAPEDNLDFSKMKKKKKKTTHASTAAATPTTSSERTPSPQPVPEDKEMAYTEMLQRIMAFLHQNNPELMQGEKTLVLPPPQLGRDGKKTVFTNFQDICRCLNREPDHLLSFMLTELGCKGNLDGNNRLVIRDRFQPKSFEVVLKRYVKEYVFCNVCKGTDTVLTREEGRMYQVHCGRCGASRNVGAIKQGFVAQVGRRKKEVK